MQVIRRDGKKHLLRALSRRAMLPGSLKRASQAIQVSGNAKPPVNPPPPGASLLVDLSPPPQLTCGGAPHLSSLRIGVLQLRCMGSGVGPFPAPLQLRVQSSVLRPVPGSKRAGSLAIKPHPPRVSRSACRFVLGRWLQIRERRHEDVERLYEQS